MKWIRCDERLPEFDEMVLLIEHKFANEKDYPALYLTGYLCSLNKTWTVRTEYGDVDNYEAKDTYYVITHWMPFPKPPANS